MYKCIIQSATQPIHIPIWFAILTTSYIQRPAKRKNIIRFIAAQQRGLPEASSNMNSNYVHKSWPSRKIIIYFSYYYNDLTIFSFNNVKFCFCWIYTDWNCCWSIDCWYTYIQLSRKKELCETRCVFIRHDDDVPNIYCTNHYDYGYVIGISRGDTWRWWRESENSVK